MFCKQDILKKSQNSQKAPILESLFSKVAGPEVCFPMNFGKLFYRTAPVAATDYSGLYDFVSNPNGTSLDKENYLDFIRI